MPNRLAANRHEVRTGGAPKGASVLRRAPSGAPPRRYSSLRPPLTPRRWHRPRERGLTRRPPVPTAVCEAKTPEAGSRYSCRRAPGRGEPLEPVLVPAASQAPRPSPRDTGGLQLASSRTRDGGSLVQPRGAGITSSAQCQKQTSPSLAYPVFTRPDRHASGSLQNVAFSDPRTRLLHANAPERGQVKPLRSKLSA